MVSRVHERNDNHTCVKDYISSLPNLDKVIKEMICIPCGWWVTKEDREYIVETIENVNDAVRTLGITYEIIVIDDVSKDRLVELEEKFYDFLDASCSDLLSDIKTSGELNEETENSLKSKIEDFVKGF